MVAEKDAFITELKGLVEKLEGQVGQYRHAKFGPKSEKLDPAQLELALEDLETGIAETQAQIAVVEEKIAAGAADRSTSGSDCGVQTFRTHAAEPAGGGHGPAWGADRAVGSCRLDGPDRRADRPGGRPHGGAAEVWQFPALCRRNHRPGARSRAWPDEKAIKTGRISLEADGSIDPERADAQWAAQTDPSKQRGPNATALGVSTSANTAAAQEALGDRKPVPRAALDSVNDTLRDADADSVPGGGGGEVSFLRARMANEVLKAQTAKVKLAKMKDELVDRPRAMAMVFDLARRERDA